MVAGVNLDGCTQNRMQVAKPAPEVSEGEQPGMFTVKTPVDSLCILSRHYRRPFRQRVGKNLVRTNSTNIEGLPAARFRDGDPSAAIASNGNTSDGPPPPLTRLPFALRYGRKGYHPIPKSRPLPTRRAGLSDLDLAETCPGGWNPAGRPVTPATSRAGLSSHNGFPTPEDKSDVISYCATRAGCRASNGREQGQAQRHRCPELGPDTGAVAIFFQSGRVLARHQTHHRSRTPDQTKRSARIKGGDPARESRVCNVSVREDFVTAPPGPPDRRRWASGSSCQEWPGKQQGSATRFSEATRAGSSNRRDSGFDGKTRGHMPDIARQFITYGFEIARSVCRPCAEIMRVKEKPGQRKNRVREQIALILGKLFSDPVFGCLREAMPTAQLADRNPRVRFLQKTDDLLFAVALLHQSLRHGLDSKSDATRISGVTSFPQTKHLTPAAPPTAQPAQQ